jgi:recombination protein RecR
MRLPPSLQTLIIELGKLPGIGPRSAERLALHLVQTDIEAVRRLSAVLIESREKVSLCQQCGGFTETPLCDLCGDPRRDQHLICVVERPVDILNIEKSGAFSGVYHVLGGKISPINGIGPENLQIAKLEQRLCNLDSAELIIALSSDVEGDATSYYLAKRLAAEKRKVTRLAHGLPVGGSLEFADELTLSRAIEGRRQMT